VFGVIFYQQNTVKKTTNTKEGLYTLL